MICFEDLKVLKGIDFNGWWVVCCVYEVKVFVEYFVRGC